MKTNTFADLRNKVSGAGWLMLTEHDRDILRKDIALSFKKEIDKERINDGQQSDSHRQFGSRS